MTLSVTHSTVAVIPDDGVSEVGSDEWNDTHILSGTLDAAQMPALTGDVTTPGASLATTLATVNSNVGTFGSATTAPVVTVNAKGLVTAASSTTISEVLTANRTYYVRSDGSDSNTGLVNSAGGAFLTLQKAANVIGGLDLANLYSVFVEVLGGSTYSSSVNLPPLVRSSGSSGGASIYCTSGTATLGAAIGINCNGSGWTVGGGAGTLKFVCSDIGVAIGSPGIILFLGAGIEFGACANQHIACVSAGSQIYSYAAYAITGQSSYHLYATSGGTIKVEGANTLSGSLAFGGAFAYCFDMGIITAVGSSWTGGTITGGRYESDYNSVISTAGGGPNFFPGSVAGFTFGGGVYH